MRSALAVMKAPWLWGTAVRQVRRTAPAGWWKQRPFLPLPSGDYLEFRLLTQYGDAGHSWDPDDVLHYLQWCKEWDSRSR